MRRQPHTIAAALGFLAMGLALAAPARAEEVPVPVNLQAELLFMIAGHDRNLPERAGGQVRTFVVTRPTDDSARGAAQFRAVALGRPVVAGLPHLVEVLPFTSAQALGEVCRARRPAILYLAPGFSGADAAAIGQALEGCSVLSAAAAPGLVKKGVVLGFDLVAGRAKPVVDLGRASRQHVSFSPSVLGLMAVNP
jgi:hypothetical protein